MMRFILNSSASVIAVLAVAACEPVAVSQSSANASDACGASAYQGLVGGPSSAATALDVPGSSRHYGSEESVATDDPSRLNFVHSGTAFESLANPASTIIRVFCG